MKTRIENTSGEEKHFGFLPPHGLTLAADGAVTLDGDLRSALGAGRNRYSRSREIAALDLACANGDICYVPVDEECCSSSSSSL
jgi:hypothetical protein